MPSVRRFFILFLCLFLFPMSAAAAGLTLKDGALVSGNQKIDDVEVIDIANSDLRLAALSEEDAEAAKQRPGVYIFDASGKQRYLLEVEYPEAVTEASLSPGGSVIVLVGAAMGTSTLDFRELATGKELGKTEDCYFVAGGPGFLWVDDSKVVMSAGSFEGPDWYEVRKCEYDPCLAVSVAEFDIAAGKPEILFEGTGTCDYVLMELKNGTVQAEKRCKAKPEDWKEAWPEDGKPEMVTRALTKK